MGMSKNREPAAFATQREKEEHYRDKALGYLGYRMRSEREIREYLRRQGCDEDTGAQILKFLREYGFVDDLRFAQCMVHDCTTVRHLSARDIAGKLRQKGISRDDIQRVLQEDPVDEEAQARAVFEKKCRAMRAPEVDKLYRYMVGKGFSYDIVRRLLSEQNGEAAPRESRE